MRLMTPFIVIRSVVMMAAKASAVVRFTANTAWRLIPFETLSAYLRLMSGLWIKNQLLAATRSAGNLSMPIGFINSRIVSESGIVNCTKPNAANRSMAFGTLSFWSFVEYTVIFPVFGLISKTHQIIRGIVCWIVINMGDYFSFLKRSTEFLRHYEPTSSYLASRSSVGVVRTVKLFSCHGGII